MHAGGAGRDAWELQGCPALPAAWPPPAPCALPRGNPGCHPVDRRGHRLPAGSVQLPSPRLTAPLGGCDPGGARGGEVRGWVGQCRCGAQRARLRCELSGLQAPHVSTCRGVRTVVASLVLLFVLLLWGRKSASELRDAGQTGRAAGEVFLGLPPAM